MPGPRPAPCSPPAVPAGTHFWRLTRDRQLASLQPAQMHRFWRGLPLHLGGVDAVYERTTDHKIVFFKGGLPAGCPGPRAHIRRAGSPVLGSARSGASRSSGCLCLSVRVC